MSRLLDRVQSLIDKFGEDFTVGGVTRRGVFSNMTTGNARAYLTFAEIDSIILPIWSCVVTSTDATVVGDTVVWNGLTLLVKKIAQARFQGGLVGKLLVLG